MGRTDGHMISKQHFGSLDKVSRVVRFGVSVATSRPLQHRDKTDMVFVIRAPSRTNSLVEDMESL